jgi:hypothetical protein
MSAVRLCSSVFEATDDENIFYDKKKSKANSNYIQKKGKDKPYLLFVP